MSTIQKIVDNLDALRGDKVVKLSRRYEEHSSWLSGEFKLIKQLIKQKNTQRLSSESKNAEMMEEALKEAEKAAALHVQEAQSSSSKPNSVFKIAYTAASAVSTEASAASAASAQAISKKRKSPEQALDPVKLSPEQKRFSIDFEKITSEAKLPHDLTRMRKDDMLQELENRGHISLNMKCLKKDIVDALKDVLIREARNKHIAASTSAAQSTVASVAVKFHSSPEKDVVVNTKPLAAVVLPAPAPTQENTTSSKAWKEAKSSPSSKVAATTVLFSPVRVPKAVVTRSSYSCDSKRTSAGTGKGTVFSEFRQQLNEAASPRNVAQSTQEDLKLKAQNEYERRLSKAQARKSLVTQAQAQTTDVAVAVVADAAPTHAAADVLADDDEVFTEQTMPSERPSALTPPSYKQAPAKAPPATKAASPATSASTRVSDCSINEDTWMEVASPQPDRSLTTLQNGINMELTGNSPPRTFARVQAQAPAPVVQQSVAPPAAPAPVATIAAAAPSRTAVQVNSLMNLGSGIQKSSVTNTTPPNPMMMKTHTSPKAAQAVSSVAEKIAALEKSDRKPITKPTTVDAADVAAVVAVAAQVKAISPLKPNDSTFKQNFSFMKEEPKSNIAAAAAAAVEKPVKKGLFSFLAGKSKAEVQQPLVAPHAAAPVVASLVMTAISAPVVSKPVASHTPSTSVVPKPISTLPAPVMKMTPSKAAANVPAQVPVHKQGDDEYKIADNDSDGDSGSGTDDDDEDKKKQNRIPDWARGAQLKEALEKQYGMYGHKPLDPDSIFMEVQTCSLEEIFGTKEGKSGKYSHRSSSAKWDQDEITLIEKRTYRNQMGLSAH